MAEWIRADDRLPLMDGPGATYNCSDRVLIAYMDGDEIDVTIACFVRARADSDLGVWCPDDHPDYLNRDEVTHWMPLPRPPES